MHNFRKPLFLMEKKVNKALVANERMGRVLFDISLYTCSHLQLNRLKYFSNEWIVCSSSRTSPHFITHIRNTTNPFKKFQPLLHNIVCLVYRWNITFNEPRNLNGNAPVSRHSHTSNPIKSSQSIETNRSQRYLDISPVIEGKIRRWIIVIVKRSTDLFENLYLDSTYHLLRS